MHNSISEIEARRKLKFWTDELEKSCQYLLKTGYLGFNINPYTYKSNNIEYKGYRAFQRIQGKVKTVVSPNLRDMKKKIDMFLEKQGLHDHVMRKHS